MSKTVELARHLETLHINNMYKNDFYWTWDKTDEEMAALAKWASFRLSAICTCRGWVKLIVNSSIKFFALTTCSPSTTSMA